MEPTHLFLDLDGVFADFDGGIMALLGQLPGDHNKREMWKAVKKQKGHFWSSLELLPDADRLWRSVKHLRPTFLTGTIRDDGSCEKAKVLWVKRHFQTNRIICCMASEKPRYMRNPGDVLVDDRQKNVSEWERAGGIGVLHFDADTTLFHLRHLGFDV